MERNEPREAPVAVAINREKSSHQALKWAVEHYIPRGWTVKLVHVIQRSAPNASAPSSEDELPVRPRNDKQSKQMFLSLRCLCMRRNIQSEVTLLEDQDVAKALIEYVSQNHIGTLLLGATVKKSITRLFKGDDISSNVMRWVPDFCNVFVISKGRLASARSATRPLPPGLPPASGSTTPLLPSTRPTSINDEIASVMSLSREDDASFEELSAHEPDIAVASCERISTDSSSSFYEKLGCRNMWDSPRLSSDGGKLQQKSKFSFDLDGSLDLSSIAECSPGRSAPDNTYDIEAEMRRIKTELKQTSDMYHEACQEAMVAKQKVTELGIWKKKVEQKLQMAEETTIAVMEKERAKCKAATEKAEAAQRLVELEAQRRVDAEVKAAREAEERKLVLDALGQSRIVVKYESLLHIMVVLFLFYFYFSLFK